jgi:hypothetical protein
LASTLIVPLSQAIARANEERLGEVNFPISCSPAAQQQFDRAVAMQHSFFFPETVKAFTANAEKEPSCAMAYWGIAISQRPNPLVGPLTMSSSVAGRSKARGFAENRSEIA